MQGNICKLRRFRRTECENVFGNPIQSSVFPPSVGNIVVLQLKSGENSVSCTTFYFHECRQGVVREAY